jgi:hypothetical protein
MEVLALLLLGERRLPVLHLLRGSGGGSDAYGYYRERGGHEQPGGENAGGDDGEASVLDHRRTISKPMVAFSGTVG